MPLREVKATPPAPSHLALGLRDRLRVPLALRVLVLVLLLVALALLLATATGALYAHCSPVVTSRPLTPPTWMKYKR